MKINVLWDKKLYILAELGQFSIHHHHHHHVISKALIDLFQPHLTVSFKGLPSRLHPVGQF